MSRLFFPNNLKEKTMAAAFIRDEDQKVFLVKNTKWNKLSGPGGHVEGNESPWQCLVREVREETGWLVDGLPHLVAVMGHLFEGSNEYWEVHHFLIEKPKGEPVLSSELSGYAWFYDDYLPFKEMWADNRFWIPLVFRSSIKCTGLFLYDKRKERVLKHHLAQERLKKPTLVFPQLFNE